MHLIAGLEIGGCQTSLLRVASGLDGSCFRQEVVSLTFVGPVGERLRAAGIPVRALGMRPGVPDPVRVARFLRDVSREPPALIQTWMYQSDLLGGLAASVAGGEPALVWGVRHGRLEPGAHSWHMRLSARACALLSGRLPAAIVCPSESSRRWHADHGYHADRITTIPNGFDTDRFRPDPEAYRDVRAELGIPPEAVIVGHVARFDPQKRHRDVVDAAARVCRENDAVHVVLCGDGLTGANPVLAEWVRETRHADRFHSLGVRTDIWRLMAAMDVLVLASSGEGFANCVGEAMACGVPCVVTDVGDANELVGETGVVVAVGDVVGLARGIRSLLALAPSERARIGAAARRRIEESYGQSRMISEYGELYADVIARRGPRHRERRGARATAA